VTVTVRLVRAVTAGHKDGGARTVIAVEVTNVGSDMNAVGPMLDRIEAQTGQLPNVLLADANPAPKPQAEVRRLDPSRARKRACERESARRDLNHAGHAGVEHASERDVEVIIAVPKRSKAPAAGDPRPAIESWKKRMETADAKAMYRQRAGLCELTNAHMRNLGMDRFLVRGIRKVTCVALMTALAMNLVSHAAKLLA